MIRFCCDIPDAIAIRNALKLLLDSTPDAGYEEVKHILANIQLHIEMALKQDNVLVDV